MDGVGPPAALGVDDAVGRGEEGVVAAHRVEDEARVGLEHVGGMVALVRALPAHSAKA